MLDCLFGIKGSIGEEKREKAERGPI